MKTALDKIQQLFAQYPSYPVIIAYSGGADSQVLLELVCQAIQDENHELHGKNQALKEENQEGKAANQQINFRELLVCHIHHGLSANADSWQQFAESECQRRGIALKVVKVSLALDSGESVEALARDARYQALIAASAQPALVLTGHHIDDQLETLLLALKRGSGVKGLGAMASQSTLAQHILCRPLLSVSRRDIEAYATRQNLAWITDESNADSRYDRNFLRNEVIPSLTARWPSFSQAAARSAELCQQNQQLVDELAAQDLASFDCQPDPSAKSGLPIEQLAKLSEVRFNNLIRYFLSVKLTLPEGEAIQMPSQAQLAQLYQQLDVAEDKVPEIKLGSVWARRFKGQLFFTPSFADLSQYTAEIKLDELAKDAQVIELPDNLGQLVFTLLKKPAQTELILKKEYEFNKESELKKEYELNKEGDLNKEREKSSLVVALPVTVNQLSIQFSHNNPKILPDYRHHSRPMKKVLQELNIAPWQRKRLPFVYVNHDASHGASHSTSQGKSALELVALPSYFVCQPFLPKVDNNKVVYLALDWQERA